MIPADLLNHLWQSTLFAAVAGLLTLLLRRNRARTRYWLWLAASMKFLIPFALLVNVGSYFAPRTPSASIAAPAQPSIEQTLLAPALAIATPVAVPQSPSRLPAVLFAAWLCGFLIVLFFWWRQWHRIRVAVRCAKPCPVGMTIPTMSSPTLLEPGVFGVLRPVLLLPDGIGERLTPNQLQAILAHELCHVRCHDNLAAAVHMLVEAVFWFHPLVWWIGKRLVDERERACDEEVLRLGSEPRAYAEGILKVCELYLESPLACVAGITGSNLRKRIRGIMMHRVAQQLDAGRKLLLMATAAAAFAGPVWFGVLNAPQIRAQSQATVAAPAFEVASIRQIDLSKAKRRWTPRRLSPNGIEYYASTLRTLISDAYHVKEISVSIHDSQSKDLLDRDRYDIAAKTDHEVPAQQLMLMLQTLLADRFKLALHRESKVEPVYKLVTAANGPKLQESASAGDPGCALGAEGGAVCHQMTMAAFSTYLTDRMGRVVLDQTGLKGSYDFVLRLEGTPGTNQIRETMSSSADPAAAKIAMAASIRDWSSTSIFTDIQKQLGLKLEADKAPVDNLVIDHVEKPSEN
jgi:bla regulator protein BlaR1